MRSHYLLVALSLASALMLVGTKASQAQSPTAQASLALNATLNESITLTLSPQTLNFNLLTGPPAFGNAPVTASLTWNLAATRTNVAFDAVFTNPSAALVNGASSIPAGKVLARIPGGTLSPCTAGANANRCHGISASLPRTQPFTETIELAIDRTGLTLTPGTYSGTLLFQAFAF